MHSLSATVYPTSVYSNLGLVKQLLETQTNKLKGTCVSEAMC